MIMKKYKIYHSQRFNKELTISRIELVGHKRLLKWMDQIGFKSPRNLAKFELWKKRNSKYANIKSKK